MPFKTIINIQNLDKEGYIEILRQIRENRDAMNQGIAHSHTFYLKYPPEPTFYMTFYQKDGENNTLSLDSIFLRNKDNEFSLDKVCLSKDKIEPSGDYFYNLSKDILTQHFQNLFNQSPLDNIATYQLLQSRFLHDMFIKAIDQPRFEQVYKDILDGQVDFTTSTNKGLIEKIENLTPLSTFSSLDTCRNRCLSYPYHSNDLKSFKVNFLSIDVLISTLDYKIESIGGIKDLTNFFSIDFENNHITLSNGGSPIINTISIQSYSQLILHLAKRSAGNGLIVSNTLIHEMFNVNNREGFQTFMTNATDLNNEFIPTLSLGKSISSRRLRNLLRVLENNQPIQESVTRFRAVQGMSFEGIEASILKSIIHPNFKLEENIPDNYFFPNINFLGLEVIMDYNHNRISSIAGINLNYGQGNRPNNFPNITFAEDGSQITINQERNIEINNYIQLIIYLGDRRAGNHILISNTLIYELLNHNKLGDFTKFFDRTVDTGFRFSKNYKTIKEVQQNFHIRHYLTQIYNTDNAEAGISREVFKTIGLTGTNIAQLRTQVSARITNFLGMPITYTGNNITAINNIPLANDDNVVIDLTNHRLRLGAYENNPASQNNPNLSEVDINVNGQNVNINNSPNKFHLQKYIFNRRTPNEIARSNKLINTVLNGNNIVSVLEILGRNLDYVNNGYDQANRDKYLDIHFGILSEANYRYVLEQMRVNCRYWFDNLDTVLCNIDKVRYKKINRNDGNFIGEAIERTTVDYTKDYNLLATSNWKSKFLENTSLKFADNYKMTVHIIWNINNINKDIKYSSTPGNDANYIALKTEQDGDAEYYLKYKYDKNAGKVPQGVLNKQDVEPIFYLSRWIHSTISEKVKMNGKLFTIGFFSEAARNKAVEEIFVKIIKKYNSNDELYSKQEDIKTTFYQGYANTLAALDQEKYFLKAKELNKKLEELTNDDIKTITEFLYYRGNDVRNRPNADNLRNLTIKKEPNFRWYRPIEVDEAIRIKGGEDLVKNPFYEKGRLKANLPSV